MTSTAVLGRVLLVISVSIPLHARAVELSTSVPFYQDRYPSKDVYGKRVDNFGNGDERLYGVRNFRTVLNGAVYRGGANNAFNKYGKRANQNPLPNIGLNNLCQEGFGSAIYLYPNGYASAPHSVNCSSVRHAGSQLKYLQDSPYNPDGLRTIFSEVQKAIYEPEHGPVYLHCWNGWHASGLAAALVLRQFCGWNGDDAVAYWDANTDGNDHEASFAGIRKVIRDYQPTPEFSLPSGVRARLCIPQD